jgi:hypothetical protein
MTFPRVVTKDRAALIKPARGGEALGGILAPVAADPAKDFDIAKAGVAFVNAKLGAGA